MLLTRLPDMGNSASKDNAADNCPALNNENVSSCPVPEDQRSAVYNVYNQRIDSGAAASTSSPRTGYIDPRNNMPTEPNQQPCAGQRQLISTNRLVSNIPKGGTSGTWVYPSPQMFYNCEWTPNKPLYPSACSVSRHAAMSY